MKAAQTSLVLAKLGSGGMAAKVKIPTSSAPPLGFARGFGKTGQALARRAREDGGPAAELEGCRGPFGFARGRLFDSAGSSVRARWLLGDGNKGKSANKVKIKGKIKSKINGSGRGRPLYTT